MPYVTDVRNPEAGSCKQHPLNTGTDMKIHPVLENGGIDYGSAQWPLSFLETDYSARRSIGVVSKVNPKKSTSQVRRRFVSSSM
jgi:hypothetical protein